MGWKVSIVCLFTSLETSIWQLANDFGKVRGHFFVGENGLKRISKLSVPSDENRKIAKLEDRVLIFRLQ